MLKIEAETGQKTDIVAMVQGDEPMLVPDMIELAVRPILNDSAINVVNLMGKILTVEKFDDPNEVKVVVDPESNAIYFSREPIPSRRKGATSIPMLKQVCIIPFQRDFLLKFNELESTPLEIIESVDMMRVIEHGLDRATVFTDATEKYRKRWGEDKKITGYINRYIVITCRCLLIQTSYVIFY